MSVTEKQVTRYFDVMNSLATNTAVTVAEGSDDKSVVSGVSRPLSLLAGSSRA